jgi:hypothetical protein
VTTNPTVCRPRRAAVPPDDGLTQVSLAASAKLPAAAAARLTLTVPERLRRLLGVRLRREQDVDLVVADLLRRLAAVVFTVVVQMAKPVGTRDSGCGVFFFFVFLGGGGGGGGGGGAGEGKE